MIILSLICFWINEKYGFEHCRYFESRMFIHHLSIVLKKGHFTQVYLYF